LSGDHPAARLLGAAFEVLRAEAPAHHEALCMAVLALPVNVVVADERLAVHVSTGALHVGAPHAAPEVTVTTSLAATRALLDAERTLVATIERGELDVRGSAAALDAAADAFMVFLHGLVRAPSSVALLVELRCVSGDCHA
jgi:hypothetical protein